MTTPPLEPREPDLPNLPDLPVPWSQVHLFAGIAAVVIVLLRLIIPAEIEFGGVLPKGEGDLGPTRPRMALDVRESFLYDPIEYQQGLTRKAFLDTSDPYFDL